MTKKIWEKPNPRKHSKPLTASQKAKAKRSATAEGRDQPGLVDNINAAKSGSSKDKKGTKGTKGSKGTKKPTKDKKGRSKKA